MYKRGIVLLVSIVLAVLLLGSVWAEEHESTADAAAEQISTPDEAEEPDETEEPMPGDESSLIAEPTPLPEEPEEPVPADESPIAAEPTPLPEIPQEPTPAEGPGREFDCAVALCQEGMTCVQGIGCVPDDEDAGDLQATPGITPDSPLYFIDEFFEQFASDLENREEKIAEIKAMVAEGKIEEAKIALEKYKGYADALEKEVAPDDREEAERSAKAIRKAIVEIGNDIPEGERDDFVEVIEKEKNIQLAAEIAVKIKELCVQLSALDPLEYARVCRTSIDDNAPQWQKKLDKDLTEAQRKEAQEFGQILGECFKTSGQQCRCEDIDFVAMSEMCAVARPLAVACDIEGDEEACDKLDSLEMPELPDYLEDVLFTLESQYAGDNYDHHIPGPCREAGITGRERGDQEKCFQIMIDIEAPPECRDALKEAKVTSEREARKICEAIMFELNGPEECIDAGIRDPRECGKYMFKLNAPQECLDAGLTGEHRKDPEDCEKLMKEQRGEMERFDEGFERGRGPGPEGFGPPGARCMMIQDPNDRLICFEEAVGRDFKGDFEEVHRERYREHFEERYEDYKGEKQSFEDRMAETMERERQCAKQCSDQGKAWDFSGGVCSCRGGEPRDYYNDYSKESDREGGDDQGRERSQDYREEFINDKPISDYVDDYSREDYSPEDGDFQERHEGVVDDSGSGSDSSQDRSGDGDESQSDNGGSTADNEVRNQGGDSGSSSDSSGSGSSDSGSRDSGSSDSSGSGSDSSGSGSDSGGSNGGDSGSGGASSDSGGEITGSFIANDFLRYYFK